MAGLSPTRAASPIQAAVDGNGRVVPLSAAAAQAKNVGKAVAAPCGAAVPLGPDAAKTLVARVAAEEGFFPDFVISVAKIESHYKSTALSDKGAYGLMQLMPETAQRFGSISAIPPATCAAASASCTCCTTATKIPSSSWPPTTPARRLC